MNHWPGNRIFFESDFHRQKRDKQQKLVESQFEKENVNRDGRGFSVNRFGMNRLIFLQMNIYCRQKINLVSFPDQTD